MYLTQECWFVVHLLQQWSHPQLVSDAEDKGISQDPANCVKSKFKKMEKYT